jgi:hypothetical protein
MPEDDFQNGPQAGTFVEVQYKIWVPIFESKTQIITPIEGMPVWFTQNLN